MHQFWSRLRLRCQLCHLLAVSLWAGSCTSLSQFLHPSNEHSDTLFIAYGGSNEKEQMGPWAKSMHTGGPQGMLHGRQQKFPGPTSAGNWLLRVHGSNQAQEMQRWGQWCPGWGHSAQVGLSNHSPASLDDRTLVRWRSPLLSSQRGARTLGHATLILLFRLCPLVWTSYLAYNLTLAPQ